MDGSVNPSEVATLSLLGGGGGGGLFNRGQFADDGSNAVRINSNRHLSSASHDAISQQISDNADRNRDLQQFGQRSAIADSLTDKINDQTRFFAGEVNMLSREQQAIAREAAKCCCEAKLLAVENQAKTDAKLAEILANQACDSKVAAAVANATQNAKLDILLAERGGHHGRG